MKRPVNRIFRALAALVLASAALVGACGHDIGDACKSSVDCDPNGTRACDLSQVGGYCTVIGCSESNCPGGSTCIRTFPEALLAQHWNASANPPVTTVLCDPTAPAMSPTNDCAPDVCAPAGFCAKKCDPSAAATSQCPAGQVCPAVGYCAQCDPAREDIPSGTGPTQNNCLADEICLDSGLCAKQSSEQRQCAKSCSSNGDCRGGYDCRKAGLLGSMVLASNPEAMTAFCAPHVAPLP
jgi:hypothetical protein